MNNRPKNPAYARNKNVLVIGGSGAGKTRFWLKPNLLQAHSSYVITDPKGEILLSCGNFLLREGYDVTSCSVKAMMSGSSIRSTFIRASTIIRLSISIRKKTF